MDDCILWEGTITKSGYGLKTYYSDGRVRSMSAHRWVWIQERGSIGEGLQMDHLCFNRACVNLDHLEPVTPRENSLRAKARITHCPAGHPLSGDNLIPSHMKNGRACMTCNTDKRREREDTIRRAVKKAGIRWTDYIQMYGPRVGPAREILGGE